MFSILVVMKSRDFEAFKKRLGGLRKESGLPKQVNFYSLRNTFATLTKNGGALWSLISQLMGYKDDNMILDVYSGGLVIKPFRESISKLSCGGGD